MFDYFNDVAAKAKAGNAKAKEVMQLGRRRVVHVAPGSREEDHRHRLQRCPARPTPTTSPRSRRLEPPDIPLHYLAMLKNTRPRRGLKKPEEDGKRGPMQFIEDLKKKGHLVAYVGDVVGTGSSASPPPTA